jgi:hypothetical protein
VTAEQLAAGPACVTDPQTRRHIAQREAYLAIHPPALGTLLKPGPPPSRGRKLWDTLKALALIGVIAAAYWYGPLDQGHGGICGDPGVACGLSPYMPSPDDMVSH